MYKVRYSTKFKRDVKLAKKRGLPIKELKDVIETLAAGNSLAPKYHDHNLIGNYAMFREKIDDAVCFAKVGTAKNKSFSARIFLHIPPRRMVSWFLYLIYQQRRNLANFALASRGW